MGETLALLSDVLVRATPLALTGLAVAIAFRGGVWNIGADGQFLAGATLAAWVGVVLGGTHLSLPLALLGGVAAGAVWAGIAGILRSRFGVLEVISTIMLNFVAAFGVSYLVRGPLQEPTHVYPQTPSIGDAAQLPVIVPGTRVHAGVLIAIALGIIAWWTMRHTAAGFRLRVTGANPFAARSAGLVNVERVTMRAFLLSGALAGLAGAVEVCGVTYALYENLSPGYGYTAIAVALLARLDPLGTLAAALLFGVLEVAAAALQREASIPSTTAAVVEASVILVVLAVAEWRARRVEQRA
jgi:simple sugar transport system permease protein